MRSKIGALIESCRPKQWIKNLLVFALPLSDGALIGSNSSLDVFLRGVIVFICLSLISSGNYLINDLLDKQFDRHHPVKMHRPIASDRLGSSTALIFAFLLFSTSLAFISIFRNLYLTLALVAFGLLQFFYSKFLKNWVGLDLVSLSLLYVLRATIPSLYEDIALSKWYLVIFFSGALFLAAGKRHAEFVAESSQKSRLVLGGYSEAQLKIWVTVSLSLILVSYLTWIFSYSDNSNFLILLFSLAPMVALLIRVTGLVLEEHGEDPSSILFIDRINLVLIFACFVLYLLGKGFL